MEAWLPPEPKTLSPAALFRLLTMAPRPEMAIDKVRAGLADIPGRLTVVGLTAHEWAAIEGDASRLIAAALRMDGAPAFVREDDVGALPAPIASALLGVVFDAVRIVSPMRQTAAFGEWRATLCEGAKHPSNITVLTALGWSYDAFQVPNGVRFSDRPDRYFGVPFHALTDGQWMATEAARAVIEERYRK